MPLQKRVTAPENRVYRSSTPPRQLRFPDPKKRVKYGKQTTKRTSQSKQDTLTQMDFVKLLQQQADEDEDEEGDGELGDEYMTEKPPKKRRKTEGDQPSPSYHTQTLTQLERWSSTAPEEQEDTDISKPPSSARSSRFRRKGNVVSSNTVKSTTNNASRRQSDPGKMGPPCTPRKQVALEIQSSQSPETPLSSYSRTPLERSPLKEKSTNHAIPFSISPKTALVHHSPHNSINEGGPDGPEEARLNNAHISPSKRSSPVKSVRFQVPEGSSKNTTVASPTVKKEYSQSMAPNPPNYYTSSTLEILDSEAESESDIDDQDDEHVSPEEGVTLEEPETYYGDIGAETQMMAEGLISPQVEESQIVDEQSTYEDLGEETQYVESQRVSTQHVNSMAPRTVDSDIFISMHPQHVTNVLNQTKDHDFRQWRFPPSVSRVWIYETSPTCTLKYMAAIGPEKHPTEIQNEQGIGNVEFNAKPKDKPNYAYEILGLYELADPLSWAQIHANEWLKVPPAKWSWVRPAVLDGLTANLKPPLFMRSESMQNIPASSSTDTDEAEAQLVHTMLQFTHPETHKEPSPIQTMEKTIHAEQDPLSTTQYDHDPSPSQASTASYDESQTPNSQKLADVIWESPSQPVPSSNPSLELPSLAAGSDGGSELVQPFSLDSSQLLTKSQMLPASLLSDSVPGPPLCIEDSDEEDE